MRNSPPQWQPADALELDVRQNPRGPVLARECEYYAEECATLAAQSQNAELRHLLLRAAESWRWLASIRHP